jgi:hypothetical protein
MFAISSNMHYYIDRSFSLDSPFILPLSNVDRGFLFTIPVENYIIGIEVQNETI